MNRNLIATLLTAVLGTNLAHASGFETLSAIAAAPNVQAVKIAGSFRNCRIVPGTPFDGKRPDHGGWGYDLLPKQILERLAPGADCRDFNAEVETTVRI